MMTFTRLLCSIGIVHEAYASFKTNLHEERQSVRSHFDAIDSKSLLPPPLPPTTSESRDLATDPTPTMTLQMHQLTTDETRSNRLKFWLMFGLYTYLEPYADKTLGRMPLYSFTKLLLTTALMTPHASVRQFMYTKLHSHLVALDTSVARHSTHLLQGVSYKLQRATFVVLIYLLRTSLRYITPMQLEEMETRASEVQYMTKQENIRRLKESVQELDIDHITAETKRQFPVVSEENELFDIDGMSDDSNPNIHSLNDSTSTGATPIAVVDSASNENLDPNCVTSSHSHSPAIVRFASPVRERERTTQTIPPSPRCSPTRSTTTSSILKSPSSYGANSNSLLALRERTHTPQQLLKTNGHNDTRDKDGYSQHSLQPPFSFQKKRQTMGV